MNGVVTVSDILRQTALDGEQTQLVRVLGQSARGLMAIIDDILDISKIEAGMLSIRPQPVAPAKLIEQVLDLFQTSVEENGLWQVFHVDTLLPDQILADPDRLRQLIANLLGNAVKFTERGEIVVTAGYGPGQSGRDELRVDVIDTGVGIDAAHQAKLFEPFWQSDVSTTRSRGGTGLGLTICKRICDLMWGRIEVESKRRPGAHLWFAVPAPMVAPSSMGGVLSGSHILIIGYAPSEARALVAMIAAAGGRAEHLANAKAATLKARAARAAATTAATTAIIFDGSLGTAALSAVRAHFEEIGDVRQAGLPVVISTSMIHQQRWQEDPPKQAARPPVVMPLPIHFRPLIGTLTAGVQNDTSPPTTAADTLTFAPPSLSQARAQGAVVLVVEDNEIDRLVIQRLLDRLGFAAEMAKNGSAALTLLRRQRFGLVLADIHMPVMDGLKLAKEIRRIDLRTPAGHPIPIVALTADVLVSTEAVTRQAGMDAYLRKPIGIEDLRDVLAEFMPQALPLRISNPDADQATVLRNGPHIGAEDGGESRAEEGRRRGSRRRGRGRLARRYRAGNFGARAIRRHL